MGTHVDMRSASHDDHALVADVLAGRGGAFERLIGTHQALVWHIAYRMSGHPEDARDLCQEIFLRVHRTLGQFRFQSALSTWIGRVAFSVASNALQRKKIQLVDPGVMDSDPLLTIAGNDFPDRDLHRDQLRTLVLAAVDALSPLERTLITMYHLDELSIEEIASVVDAPQGTVKNYLFRARRRLRDKLAKLQEELA